VPFKPKQPMTSRPICCRQFGQSKVPVRKASAKLRMPSPKLINPVAVGTIDPLPTLRDDDRF
jgi:hypothetical protein